LISYSGAKLISDGSELLLEVRRTLHQSHSHSPLSDNSLRVGISCRNLTELLCRSWTPESSERFSCRSSVRFRTRPLSSSRERSAATRRVNSMSVRMPRFFFFFAVDRFCCVK
jgi:hypothetical protein